MKKDFEVRKTMCSSCIYGPKVPADFRQGLEDEIKDRFGFFNSYRACHHHTGDTKCCRGFWERHKDRFQMGQVAQRLNAVVFSDEGDSIEDRFPGLDLPGGNIEGEVR